MSYGVGAALQTAIYERLAADATLAAVVGDAIYDAMPRGKLPPLYVALGAETVRDRSDGSGRGAEHRFVVSVIGMRDGFKQVKAAAVAVSDALIEADMSLSRGRLVALYFDRAQARRVTARNLRRIDLRFVARVEDNHS